MEKNEGYKLTKFVLMIFVFLFATTFVFAATVEINPSTINAGDSVNAVITPSSSGFYQYVYKYDGAGVYKGYEKLSCSSYKCTSTVSHAFSTDSSWANGQGSLKVYDWATGWVNHYFTIVGGVEPKVFNLSYSPSELRVGDTLSMSIQPGSSGVYRGVYFYSTSGTYMGYSLLPSSTYRIYDPVEYDYVVPSSFQPGEYYFQVYDYSESSSYLRWKKFYFTVLPLENSDTCSDSDGMNPLVSGNVFGVKDGQNYSYFDFCASSNIVNEFYCSGDSAFSLSYSCDIGSMNKTTYCMNGSVFEDIPDNFCSLGKCVHSFTTNLVEECSDGCESGACVVLGDTTSPVINYDFFNLTLSATAYDAESNISSFVLKKDGVVVSDSYQCGDSTWCITYYPNVTGIYTLLAESDGGNSIEYLNITL